MSKLKEKIKVVQDLKSEKINIPEWDVVLELRTMKAIDRYNLGKPERGWLNEAARTAAVVVFGAPRGC